MQCSARCLHTNIVSKGKLQQPSRQWKQPKVNQMKLVDNQVSYCTRLSVATQPHLQAMAAVAPPPPPPAAAERDRRRKREGQPHRERWSGWQRLRQEVGKEI